MQRFQSFVSAGVILAVLVAAGCEPAGEPPSETSEARKGIPPKEADGAPPGNQRPNVIWILLDACRADHLSCYGYDRETSPNVDRLAGRGVLFERMHAQCNITRLSVPSFLTGRYFAKCTFDPVHWRAMSRVRPPEEQYLSEILSDNGYHTLVLTAHPGISPKSELRAAFDEYKWVFPKPEEHRAYSEFEALNAFFFSWLEERDRENPFFAYVHTLDTHAPHYVRPEHHLWFGEAHEAGKAPAPPYAAQEQAYLAAEYDGSVHYADAQVGLLLGRLDALGLRDNTIVIVHSDHGEVLGEDGKTIGHPPVSVQEILRVPFVMAGPGIPSGERVAQLTQNIDIVPSLVELLGLPTDARFDGRSFVPLLGNPDARARHEYAVFRALYGQLNEDSLNVLSLHDGRYTYEYNPHEDAEFLWQAPDRFGKRRDVISEAPDAAAALRARLDEDIMPLRHAYEALPQIPPDEFVESIAEAWQTGCIQPESACVARRSGTDTDGKFAMDGRSLISASWQEDPPPVSMRFTVPNGIYEVTVLVHLGERQGHKRSSLSIKAQDDAAFKLVKPEDMSETAAAEAYQYTQYLDAGTYTVDDGVFDVSVDNGDPGHWVWCDGFRFVRVGESQAVSETPGQAKETEDALRAIGYLQ